MKITEAHLERAVERNILSADQAAALNTFLKEQPDTGPTFDFTHLLYYFGGLVAIGAMSLFMNLGWEQFGGWGIFFISLAYAGVGLKLTEFFRLRGFAVPAGICATFVVALTPLAIYGLQNALGWWPDESPYQAYHRYIRWHWIFLEFGTLIVGVIMARRSQYPFMLMPIAVTLWYMSMDIPAMLIEGANDFEFRSLVTMQFGLAMTVIAIWTDIRSRKAADYAFWLYIFGVMAFWGGLTSQDSNSELGKFVYFCINLILIGCGAILVRRVFVVFGGLGSAIYLSHLADTVFKDSWLFPAALTAIGLGIIYAGIVWQKREKEITARIHSLLPDSVRELLQARIRGAT